MANGATVAPIEAAYITVIIHNKLSMGTAHVMQMEDMDLLLGNDFLKQFGKLYIDYEASKTLITVGDFPLSLIEPQKMELTKSNKIRTTEGVNIPTSSVRNVSIVSQSGAETQLLTPSRRLRMHQAQTVDHAFLPDRTTTVSIANISSQEVWLDKGSTLEEAQLCFFEDLEQVLKADNNSAVPDAPTDTLSVIARPEALVQPLSQDTKIRTQYRGNLTDLPPIRWWRPNFLFLWLPYCFLLLMFSFGPHTYAVLVRDTVLFNEQTGLAMSESSC